MDLFITLVVFLSAVSSATSYIPELDIMYLLYTKGNPTTPQVIKKGDAESLAASNFDVTKPVKVLVHGWLGGTFNIINVELRQAFIENMDVNVISAIWHKGADSTYDIAYINSLVTAPSIAGFLDWLSTQNVPFTNMHVLGHSLGVHLAGLIGRTCKLGQLEHITGLDPILIHYESESSGRILKTDAKYIEIIHTTNILYGTSMAMGHNDFYPNGGIIMPGCPWWDSGVCSHMRAVYYMGESLNNQKFMATLCPNLTAAHSGSCASSTKLHMGGARKIKPALGIFHLKTNAFSPYHINNL